MRYITLSLVSLALAACSPPDATTTSAAAPTNSTEATALQTDQDKTLYALGLVIGQNVRENVKTSSSRPTKPRSSRTGYATPCSVPSRRSRSTSTVRRFRRSPRSECRRRANEEKAASEAWVAEQAALPGAERSATGVVIIPMTEGTGANPTATSTVRVHYHGTLRDGTVFDSSVQRGEPISFPLNGVISCWTEGVQKIKVGGKAKLVCPADTAYGDQGSGSIPGGAALAFEVELLAIE